MPKKASSKNKEWERERRERLNNSFKDLQGLLPSHNPTASLSKVDIVTKSAEYIRELKKKNTDLLEGNKPTNKECLEQVASLERRVKELVEYAQLLASLLRAAGISVPPGPGPDINVLLKRPLKWSGKLSLEQTLQHIVETRQKKCSNNVKKKNSKFTGQKSKSKQDSKVSLLTPQATSKTETNINCNISNVSAKGQTKSSNKNNKKLTKAANSVALTNASGLQSVVTPVNSSGTLIFTNGTVMPVLSTRMVSLPLLVSRGAKLPIAALARPAMTRKAQSNHSRAMHAVCSTKGVASDTTKSSTSGKTSTAKIVPRVEKTVKISPKLNTSEELQQDNNNKLSEPTSLKRKETGFFVQDGCDEKVSSNAEEHTNTQELSEEASATEKTGVAMGTLAKEGNSKICVTNDFVVSNDHAAHIDEKPHHTVDKNNGTQHTVHESSNQVCKDSSLTVTTDVTVNSNKPLKVEYGGNSKSIHQENSNKSCGKTTMSETCVTTENASPILETDQNEGFGMQIDNGQFNAEMNVSSPNKHICSNGGFEISSTNGKMSTCLDIGAEANIQNIAAHKNLCNSINSLKNHNSSDSTLLSSNQDLVSGKKALPCGPEEGKKRKCYSSDDTTENELSRKKGKKSFETNQSRDNLPITACSYSSTSKLQCSTSNSMIMPNEKCDSLIKLPRQAAYSVDSLCKTKSSLDAVSSKQDTTSSKSQDISSKSTATSKHNMENQNTEVSKVLLDVMGNITPTSKCCTETGSFNTVLCASELQQKCSNNCNLVQRQELEKNGEHHFNNYTVNEVPEAVQGISDNSESNINQKLPPCISNNSCVESETRHLESTLKQSCSSVLTTNGTNLERTEYEVLLLKSQSIASEEQNNMCCEIQISERNAQTEQENVNELSDKSNCSVNVDANLDSHCKSTNTVSSGVLCTSNNLAKMANTNKYSADTILRSDSEKNVSVPDVDSNNESEKVSSSSKQLQNDSLNVRNEPVLAISCSTKSDVYLSQIDPVSEIMVNKELDAINENSTLSNNEHTDFMTKSLNNNATISIETEQIADSMSNCESNVPPLSPKTDLQKRNKNVYTAGTSLNDCMSTFERDTLCNLPEKSSYNIQNISRKNSTACPVNSISVVHSNTHCAFKGSEKVQSADPKLAKNIHFVESVIETNHCVEYSSPNRVTTVLPHTSNQKQEKVSELCVTTSSQESVSSVQVKTLPKDLYKSGKSEELKISEPQDKLYEKENGTVPEDVKGECQNLFGNCHCNGSEFTGDLFASLNVPTGHCSESVSPTAQFLLSFPLVSGGSRQVDNVTDETVIGQGSSSLLQIGASEQSRSVGTQVCSSDTGSGTNKISGSSEQDMSVNNNSFMVSDTFSKIGNVSVAAAGNDHNLPLFKAPPSNRFSFAYDSYGCVSKRPVEASPLKTYGPSENFRSNFSLPEPCLASLPFDKSFIDHKKSFPYTNLSKPPITGHLPVNIVSGICPVSQSSNVTVNFIQSNLGNSHVHKINSSTAELFKSSCAESVQSNTQNLFSSTVCQNPPASNTAKYISGNQSANTSNSINSTITLSSFGDEAKSTTMSSFSIANNSSNFGIISWSTIPPMAAVSNVSQSENFTNVRNLSSRLLSNIPPPTSKVDNSNDIPRSCMQNSSLNKPGQQQLKDYNPILPRHAQDITSGYTYSSNTRSGQESFSSRGSNNSLMPISANQVAEQHSHSEASAHVSKSEYENCKESMSAMSNICEKFSSVQTAAYKLVTTHSQPVQCSNENPGYKQTSPTARSNYTVDSTSLCNEKYAQMTFMHDKYKLPSSHSESYHRQSEATQRGNYKTTHEEHAGCVPSSAQPNQYKMNIQAGQKRFMSDKSNNMHLASSDEFNNYNPPLSFKQDGYSSLAVSSICNQNLKPVAAHMNAENYKSTVRSDGMESYKKVSHTYQPAYYKKGSTSMNCDSHKSPSNSLQLNSCKAPVSITGNVNNLTNSQSRAPVNWMTTPDTRCSVQQVSSALFPPTTSNQLNVSNNSLASSALFLPQCNHENVQTGSVTSLPSTLFPSVSSHTTQSIILPSVTSSLFPPVTCNHRVVTGSTHSLFPTVSNTVYNNVGNAVTTNLFTPTTSQSICYSQVSSSVFPTSTINTNSQSSLLFQHPASNLLGQDNVSVAPMLLNPSSAHTGQNSSSLVPLFPSVPGRGVNQLSDNMPSATNQQSTDHSVSSMPPPLFPAPAPPDAGGKPPGLQPSLSTAMKPMSGSTHLSGLPSNSPSHLLSHDGGNNFCPGSIFQSFPSAQTVHESSASVLLMPSSNMIGDTPPSSLLPPPHGATGSSSFSAGSTTFFSSPLIPPSSSGAIISGENNSCLPSSVSSTLLSVQSSSGTRHQNLSLFPGPPPLPTQRPYCRPSGPNFPALSESNTAASSSRPCFFSVSQLVEGSGNGNGKMGVTRSSRRRSRRPPPPWMSSSAVGQTYHTVPQSQQSSTRSTNKTAQQVCGRQQRSGAVTASTSELVDLGGLLGSPLLAEDHTVGGQRPSSPPTSVSSLTNFNLSTIFPDIDKQQQQHQQQQQQQQQQQPGGGFQRPSAMDSDGQQREFMHPPSTFGNSLLSPAQVCRMQWP